jgi:hypothetical protein
LLPPPQQPTKLRAGRSGVFHSHSLSLPPPPQGGGSGG